MRRLAPVILALLWLAIGTYTGSGQVPSPALGPNFRWSEYGKVERITEDFRMLSSSQATHVKGSESALYDAPMFTIPIGFGVPFTFLGETYSASAPGNDIRVSVAGFFKFNKSPGVIRPPSVASYFLEPDTGRLDKLIMPYWGDLRGTVNGGIFYRYENLDSTIQGNDRLTIEWRVRRMGDPVTVVGVFQSIATLKRWGKDRYFVAIEFHYGPTPLSWNPPSDPSEFMRGAAVGIKNRGQDSRTPAFYGRYYGSGIEYGYGEDDGNSLMITHPALFASGPEAYTQAPVHAATATGLPEWYANTPLRVGGSTGSNPSSLFHYTFPPVAYRVKPVDNDVLSIGTGMRRIDTLGVDTNRATYRGTDRLFAFASYRNLGADTARDVPVAAYLYRTGAYIRTVRDTIRVIAPGATVAVTFRDTISLSPTFGTGTHEICAYHSRPVEQYRGNDTVCRNFFVQRPDDVAPVQIVKPGLGAPPRISTYRLNTPLEVSAIFINNGTRARSDVPVGYRILDRDGKLLVTVVDTLKGAFAVGERRTKDFAPWTPSTGTFYIEVYSAMSGDQTPGNDTIASAPLWNMLWWGRTKSARDARRIPFDVRPSRDVGVADPAQHPHYPISNTAVPTPLQITALFRNHGIERASNVQVRLQIFRGSAGGPQVHEELGTIPVIEPGSAVEYRFSPQSAPFIAGGEHCVWVTVIDPADVVASNNLAEWCFSVTSAAGVADERALRASFSIHPNPATDDVMIGYHLERAAKVRLGLYDTYGALVRELSERREGGAQSVAMDLQGLPSGVYTVRLDLDDGRRLIEKLIIQR